MKTVITKNEALTIQKALDTLGLALVNAKLTWSNNERKSYEEATKILQKFIILE